MGLAMHPRCRRQHHGAVAGRGHAAGLIDRQRLERDRRAGDRALPDRLPRTATPVVTMSGGNQQKVLVARWARRCRTLLILDEPTRGVDVGAKAEIYRIMRELADGGIAILMISSELTEVDRDGRSRSRHARRPR